MELRCSFVVGVYVVCESFYNVERYSYSFDFKGGRGFAFICYYDGFVAYLYECNFVKVSIMDIRMGFVLVLWRSFRKRYYGCL